MIPEKVLSPNKRFALNVLVPSVYFVPLAVAYFSPKNFGFGVPRLTGFGLGVGLLGLSLWIASTINIGRSLAVLPEAGRLVTHGIYKYLRHPMYVGITLTLFGLLLACGSAFGMIYLLVIVLPLNVIRVRLEEKMLIKTFGETYHAYRKKTLF